MVFPVNFGLIKYFFLLRHTGDASLVRKRVKYLILSNSPFFLKIPFKSMIDGFFLIIATTSFQKVFSLLNEQAISKALQNAFSVYINPLSPIPVSSSPNHIPASL